MKPIVCAIIVCAHCLSPVEKVIIVNYAASEITLTQYRDMVCGVVVGIWSHKTIDQARLPDAGNAFFPLRAREADDCYIKSSDR